MLTSLKICDNSGIKIIKCFKIYKNYCGKIGGLVKGTTKKTRANNKIQKGTIVKALIIRKKRTTDRKTGCFLSCNSNDSIVLNDKYEPVGTRTFGPIPVELRRKNYLKLLSLTSELI